MILKSPFYFCRGRSNFLYSFVFLVVLEFTTADYNEEQNVVKIAVISQATGKEYNLKLTKADESALLHPDIKVISIASADVPNEKEENIWISSRNTEEEQVKREKQSLYIDNENLAAVRLAYDSEKGEHYPVSGFVNGNRLVKNTETDKIANIIEDGSSSNNNQSDYIDIGRTITPSKSRNNDIPAIVEVVLVCDKEFGDKFNHNRQAILDYWTVYFWDVNMRYRTLPSSKISFRLNSIIIISSLSGQPFIEQSRASDGRAEFGRILERFSSWIYSKRDFLPKFDMAIAVTNTQLEWGGGLAYYRAACWTDNSAEKFYGTVVWNDGGDWGSLTVGAHEIGHSVGAPHDDDPGFPGGRCSSRGYIMSGGNDDLKWFFSPCSDRTIGEFVGSNEGSCLKRLDETSSGPAIDPDYSGVEAPSMQEQCRRRLNNREAFTREEDEGNCKVMKCWVTQKDGGWLIWSFPPVDNTPCAGGGRCFRGRCRGVGRVLKNVGSGNYGGTGDPFNYMTPMGVGECVKGATPLERFVVEEGGGGNGRYFMTPWNSRDAGENGDKCLYTGNGEGDGVWTDRCDKNNPWQGWEMNGVRGREREFLLRHRVTGRCAKEVGGWVRSYRCDERDMGMRWMFV